MYHENPDIDYYVQEISTMLADKKDISDIRSFLDGIPQKISNDLANFAQGIITSIKGKTETDDPFSELQGIFNKQNKIINQQATDLAELQDKTQQLLGVIGYGFYTIPTNISTGGANKWIKLNLNTQVGPKVGCHEEHGSIILDSKGLYFLSAQVNFDFIVAGARVQCSLRVYDPQGNLHAEKLSIMDSLTLTTVTTLMPVTIPSQGYKVELYVQGQIIRGVLAGQNNTFLSIDKRSQEEE